MERAPSGRRGGSKSDALQDFLKTGEHARLARSGPRPRGPDGGGSLVPVDSGPPQCFPLGRGKRRPGRAWSPSHFDATAFDHRKPPLTPLPPAVTTPAIRYPPAAWKMECKSVMNVANPFAGTPPLLLKPSSLPPRPPPPDLTASSCSSRVAPADLSEAFCQGKVRHSVLYTPSG